MNITFKHHGKPKFPSYQSALPENHRWPYVRFASLSYKPECSIWNKPEKKAMQEIRTMSFKHNHVYIQSIFTNRIPFLWIQLILLSLKSETSQRCQFALEIKWFIGFCAEGSTVCINQCYLCKQTVYLVSNIFMPLEICKVSIWKFIHSISSTSV